MTQEVHLPTSSFDTRKKIEEYAISKTPGAFFSPQQIDTVSTAPTSSIQPINSSSIPIGSLTPHSLNTLVNKLDEIAQKPTEALQPLDMLFLEVIRLMEQEDHSSIRIRETLLTAMKEWRQFLQQEVHESSEKARTMENNSHMFVRISQTVAPLSIIIAGSISCATGGVGTVPVVMITIGALLFIDSICDDAAKKAIASLLARNAFEEKEKWLNRIRLVSNCLTICLNVGVGYQQAIQIASVVSQTALEAVRASCDYAKDSSKARLLELNTSHEVAKNSSDLLMKKWEQIMASITERYELFLSIQKAKEETSKTIVNNI